MAVNGFDDTIKWYDEHAEQYAKVGDSNLIPEHIQRFVSLLPKHAKVLDAGCGYGRDSGPLRSSGLNVIGIDLSKGILDVARCKFPNIEFMEGNMLDLPFRSSYFDGVWSNASLVHFETINEVKQALSEMNRVLKPNGVIHVLVKAQTDKAKTAVKSDKLSGHDRFFQYFTVTELTELLEKASFKITSIKEYSEIETNPEGRPEERIIWVLAKKK